MIERKYPTNRLELTFTDRDRNKAQISIYLSEQATISAQTFVSVAELFIARLQTLSSAKVIKARLIVESEELSEQGATLGNRSHTFAKLFLENNGEINTIVIPAPKPSIFEQVGQYAYIRVDSANTALIDFLDMLTLLNIRNQAGQPIGLYIVGGFTL